MKTISIFEWLICSFGMFFVGLGVGYLDVRATNYGIGFFIFGLILEIPAFYLIYKHK